MLLYRGYTLLPVIDDQGCLTDEHVVMLVTVKVHRAPTKGAACDWVDKEKQKRGFIVDKRK